MKELNEEEDIIPLERENEKYNKLDMSYDGDNIICKGLKHDDRYCEHFENKLIKKWKEEGVVEDE